MCSNIPTSPAYDVLLLSSVNPSNKEHQVKTYKHYVHVYRTIAVKLYKRSSCIHLNDNI